MAQSLFNTYRPHNFDSVVGQKETVTLLRQQSKTGKYRNSYIFAGHFGSGKTSLARIFAMAVNCHCKDENGNPCGVCDSCRSIMEGNNADVVEYAASEKTGVEGADRLIEMTKYAPVGDYKVFIIDEVQALSAQAFQRLLKITEEPPAYCIFIFCTTEYESIPVANRSRIQKYNFTQFTHEQIAERVKYVADDAGLKISEDVPEVIAKYSEGSMRNAIVTLETATEGGAEATGETVEAVLGVVRNDALFDIIQAIGYNDMRALVASMNGLLAGGFNLTLVTNELMGIVRDLYLFKSCNVCEGTVLYKKQITETEIDLPTLQRLTTALIELKGKKLTENLIFLTLVSVIRTKPIPAAVTPTDMVDVSTLAATPSPFKEEEKEAAEVKAEPEAESKPEPKPEKSKKPKKETKPVDDFDDIFDVFGFDDSTPTAEPESESKPEAKSETKSKKETGKADEEDPFGFKEAINVDAAPVEKVAEILGVGKTEPKAEPKPVAKQAEVNPFEEANPFDEAYTEETDEIDYRDPYEDGYDEGYPYDDGEPAAAEPVKEEKREEKKPMEMPGAEKYRALNEEYIPPVRNNPAPAKAEEKKEQVGQEDASFRREDIPEVRIPFLTDDKEDVNREAYFENNFSGCDIMDMDTSFAQELAEHNFNLETARLESLAEKISDGEAFDEVEARLVVESERSARFYYEQTFGVETEFVSVEADTEFLKKLAQKEKLLHAVLCGCADMGSGKLAGVKPALRIVQAYIQANR